MQIILQEDVEKLGHRGDVVTVKPGYARNFLLPKKLAVEATPGNMKALERIRAALAKKTATELDAAKLSWRFYASVINQSGGLWSAYQAVDPIFYGPDWDKDVISPQTRFFNDLKKGELASVTWITPTCATSDHSGYTCGVNPPQGPSWVASLVNAIGESKFWTSTAIFIFWDDPGGWYDHVPPPYVNIDGLGMRVPLLVISAYAKQNYVSHIQYQNTSILKFIEDRFDLAALTKSDKHAISPEVDCFDFSQPARKFAPIPAEYDENFFMHQRPDPRPPDTE